ncbi:hypothetical protein GN958_ATG16013 [Phytophthora infestans]|uniref:BZIP domain-containing protein n=1 Tax=Phytophthora infestans TaxID=4787 RepID=A0A8S9U5Q3_PHYIN|nr:hypothetical protein GN958_ATG16013 [Phytophthora infestans]KAI9990886.1 hypothetical protein PInf_018503 [Phytophthora infestans]
MRKDDQVDFALLADVSRFLAACNATAPSVDPYHKAPASASDDGLVLASHQLLTETETLLSSLETPQEQAAPNARCHRPDERMRIIEHKEAASTDQVSADRRREHRNVQAAKRRSKYRQKLKDEKKTLEREEVELSSKLNKLKRAHEEEKMRYVDTISLSVWRAIATRQKEKRLEAENTQRQLRAQVIGRARMIHQLKALLQCPYIEDSNKLCGQADGDGSVLFKTFVSELDAIYAQTDQVLRDVKFQKSRKLTFKPTRTTKQGVELFESAYSSEVSFKYEDTSRAVSLILMTDPDVTPYTRQAQEPKDTVTVKYNVKCSLERGEVAKLKVYVAVRRVIEADRLVFVWRSLTEGQEHLAGYHTDETGWLVLRPQLINDVSSTVLENYVRFIPMTVGDTASSTMDTDRFATVVAKTGEEEVNEMMQMLEKMLLGGD